MITEDYVSFETAKLLKEKGFKEWCSKCYGVAVLHNGADISFDEECDLKDEGREDEIEYLEGRLYDYGCDNRDKDAKVWAAPTLWAAMKWLRGKHIVIVPEVKTFYADGSVSSWKYHIWCDDNYEEGQNSFSSYEEACEAGIRYVLENLI